MTTNSSDSQPPVAHMTWVKQSHSKLQPWEFELLQRSYDTLNGNIQKQEAWHGKRGIVPSTGKYQGVWNWDAAFHAMAVTRWDPSLAREQADILFDEQLPSGALPDVIFSDGRIVKDFGKPPVFPWAVALIDKHSPDKDYLARIYPKMAKYEEHWVRDRGYVETGLFHYGGGAPNLESGWDNSVRWDQDASKQWSVDLNCYMVLVYDSLVYSAKKLGLKEDIQKWQSKRKELADRIEKRLWSEKAGAYLDYSFETKEFSTALTPASFMPLYAGVASKKHAGAMAKLAADPKKFYPGMPTVAYDDPKFGPDYWRGPCWLNTAGFAIWGLERYGYQDTAEKIRYTVLRRCYDGGDPYEYYDATTGKPGKGAADKFGWSAAFIIELLLERR